MMNLNINMFQHPSAHVQQSTPSLGPNTTDRFGNLNFPQHFLQQQMQHFGTKRSRLLSGLFAFTNEGEQEIVEQSNVFGFEEDLNEVDEEEEELNHKKSPLKAGKAKKGSVISPDDRKPPTGAELLFYAKHIPVLHNLIAFNMQHLAFFPQERWLTAFQTAIHSSSSNSSAEVKLEPAVPQTNTFYEELLVEPEVETDPLLNFTFANAAGMPSNMIKSSTTSTMRIISRDAKSKVKQVALTTVEHMMLPHLDEHIKREIANLTTFQKTLARYKCREILGFYKIQMRAREISKLQSAQQMENNSRFVVRTILNWGREYLENQGSFNKSKIGKHKRVTLFADAEFRQALLDFAISRGDEISVDGASQFIRDYHAQMSRQQLLRGGPSSGADELPTPPSSRATVHRWLRDLDIKLGPRGKKKTSPKK